MNPKISIIITIYNVEKYLITCLESVKNQTVSYWECILVDDGSTDNSGIICDDIVSNDSRFKVYHIQNCGVANARNLGIRMSSGDFITFIDGDDFIVSDCLENAYNNIINQQLDIYSYGMVRYFTNGNKETLKKIKFKDISLEKNFIKYPTYMNSLCNKFFKKDLFSNNVLVNTNISSSEDLLLVFKLFFYAKNYFLDKKVGYYYRVNPSSTTTSKITKKKIEDTGFAYKALKVFCEENKIEKKYKRFLRFRNLCYSIQYLINFDFFNLEKFHEETIKRNVWVYNNRIDYCLITIAGWLNFRILFSLYFKITGKDK